MASSYGRVYCITHIASGKQYVGQTIYSLEKRWSGHRKSAERGMACRYLHNAINKYGGQAFVCEQLCEADSEQQLHALERAWIKMLDSIVPKGYNLTDGGQGGKHHPETRQKMSASAKAACAKPERKQQRDILHASQEYRHNMSRALIASCSNRKHQMSLSAKRAYRNDEYRKKTSEAGKRIWQDPEYRERISRIRQQTAASPEYRAKLKAATKIATSTPEFRARASELSRQRWASPEFRERMKQIHRTRLHRSNGDQ